jgi:pimeloyl-ACP methyl ester carboxylesterase
MTATTTHVEAPSPFLTALEVRAVAERGAMTAALPLLHRLPRGDGHPVLVLPGFVASDRSTAPLRRLLRELGYAPFGWKLGQNLGPTPEIVRGMMDRFERIAERHGRTVSVVGWSLGGIYGRELARRYPDAVRQVVTLGSPIHMRPGDRSAASRSWETLRHRHDPAVLDRSIPEMERPPLRVPATSVYTRSDGIVHWTTCLIESTPTTENVEVHGSHCGLGFNPWSVYVVADRLAQAEGRWAPFRAPLVLRAGFPRPAQWRPSTTTGRD